MKNGNIIVKFDDFGINHDQAFVLVTFFYAGEDMPILFRADLDEAGLKPRVTYGRPEGTQLLKDTSLEGAPIGGGFDVAMTLDSDVVFGANGGFAPEQGLSDQDAAVLEAIRNTLSDDLPGPPTDQSASLLDRWVWYMIVKLGVDKSKLLG